jgi:DNA-binding response OmpR family regulator
VEVHIVTVGRSPFAVALLVGAPANHASLARQLAELGCRVEVQSLRDTLASTTVPGSPEFVAIDATEPRDRDTALKVAEWFATVRRAPSVLLTRPDDVEARVLALTWGADALCIPADAREVVARAVVSVDRRARTTTLPSQLGDVTIDWESRVATRAGRTIELTGKELDVLRVLVENTGRPVAKTELLRRVWNDADRSENAVEAHISTMRRKFEVDDVPNVIQTVFGAGYTFTPVADRRRHDITRSQLDERERRLQEREEAVARRARLLRRLERELGRRLDGLDDAPEEELSGGGGRN